MSPIPLALYKLDRLGVTPPPAEIFEELLGYEGECRLVGFHYEAGKLHVSDGELTTTGNWQPWVVWHRTLALEVLRHHYFGSEDQEAEHMLILDRKSRLLYAGKAQVARDILRQQLYSLPETEPSLLSQADLEKLKEEFLTGTFGLPIEELNRRQTRLFEGVKKLRVWGS